MNHLPKAEIELKDGRWWINGKKHKHCTESEKYLYNRFLRFIRQRIETGKLTMYSIKDMCKHRFYVVRLGSGAEVLQDHYNGKVTFDVMV